MRHSWTLCQRLLSKISAVQTKSVAYAPFVSDRYAFAYLP
jgi:hypothetical protein